jgi:hypothetical protein
VRFRPRRPSAIYIINDKTKYIEYPERRFSPSEFETRYLVIITGRESQESQENLGHHRRYHHHYHHHRRPSLHHFSIHPKEYRLTKFIPLTTSTTNTTTGTTTTIILRRHHHRHYHYHYHSHYHYQSLVQYEREDASVPALQ